MMNFWIPNFHDWNEGFDPDDGMPWSARYDYVEYWEYVPQADWPTTDGANQWHPFKQTWRDDFDTFDETRWVASEDWTFSVNEVTFWESQVYTEDGSLVLKLEPRDDSTAGTDGDDNSGTNGGGGDSTGDGSTDTTSDCGCAALQASIDALREQLAAF
jgi:hypothetical protein